MRDDTVRQPATGAESVLLGMKRAGIDYLFANAGTDFPPIIEALSTLGPDEAPQPVTIPHETASVGMAHGYWLATGRPQSIMVHVNVGLANAAMGVINAASDNVPVLVMSGRTPITETGRPGHRITPIHYGQEMYDQNSLVRDSVKFSYEMRYPEQGETLVSRAMAIAGSAPEGPVYLSLPREPLSERIADDLRQPVRDRAPARPGRPDAEGIATLAGWLKAAKSPLVVAQRGDPAGKLGAALSDFANRHGIAVASPFLTRNVLASDDPAFTGFSPAAVTQADLVVVLDSDTPWIESGAVPPASARVVHIGPDPHFARMPMRGFQSDLALSADPLAAIEALSEALPAPLPGAADRLKTLRETGEQRRAKARETAQAGRDSSPMTAEWMSQCVGEIMDDRTMLFSDLGIMPAHLPLKGPNQLFTSPHSGGLGWALTSALGAQLADRDRLTIACVGDGSYMFANPVACHLIAEALELPLLTIIKNNGIWNAVRRAVDTGYPDGAASHANTMPLTALQPAPDYTQIAGASRAHVERVETGADLPAALQRAVEVIRKERRQALVDVRVAVSDTN